MRQSDSRRPWSRRDFLHTLAAGTASAGATGWTPPALAQSGAELVVSNWGGDWTANTMKSLETPAFYIGAIGSRLNSELRRDRMVEYFDVQAQDLNRLRAPVGLYIGSKTPAEIAVSIMAEVLAVKNNVPLTQTTDVAAAKNQLGVPKQEEDVVCAVG